MRRKKHFGQHFLSSFAIISREIKFINPADKRILEIGGGDGRLSVRLAKYAKELWVVEKDPDYSTLLKRTFQNNPNVHIIEGDFLEVEPFPVDLIVGNIPYNLSSAITFRLLDWSFDRAYIMYQKEFGEKLTAEGKDRSRISFFVQYYFDVKPLMVISKKYFSPPPKVDSILLELIPKDVPPLTLDEESLITQFFQHRNKRLKFTLKRFLGSIPEEFLEVSSLRINDLTNQQLLELVRDVIKFKNSR